MDKIIMDDMIFYGYHGVMEEENRLGQKFHVDANLYLDLRQAGETDDLNYTVSYAEVYMIIENIMLKERFDLLEALAHRICDEILDSFERIENVELTIKKPNAPVPGNFNFFAVQVKRSRRDYE